MDAITIGGLLVALKGGGGGIVAGFVSGLLGVSPGGILVPVVCLALNVEQHVAQAVSLVAQIPPTGLGGVSEYRRHGQNVPITWVVLLSVGFVIGGTAGALVAGGMPDQVLRWLFVGYLLILAAIAALRGRRSVASASDVQSASRPLLAAIGGVAGFSSGLLGIGGGLAVTALSTALLRVGQHKAQALSLMLSLLPLSIPSVCVYLAQGWTFPWGAIAGIVVGLWFGALAGAAVANRLPERMLKPAFVVLVLGMAAYMAVR